MFAVVSHWMSLHDCCADISAILRLLSSLCGSLVSGSLVVHETQVDPVSGTLWALRIGKAAFSP